jgi:hypothetical protein
VPPALGRLPHRENLPVLLSGMRGLPWDPGVCRFLPVISHRDSPLPDASRVPLGPAGRCRNRDYACQARRGAGVSTWPTASASNPIS